MSEKQLLQSTDGTGFCYGNQVNASIFFFFFSLSLYIYICTYLILINLLKVQSSSHDYIITYLRYVFRFDSSDHRYRICLIDRPLPPFRVRSDYLSLVDQASLQTYEYGISEIRTLSKLKWMNSYLNSRQNQVAKWSKFWCQMGVAVPTSVTSPLDFKETQACQSFLYTHLSRNRHLYRQGIPLAFRPFVYCSLCNVGASAAKYGGAGCGYYQSLCERKTSYDHAIRKDVHRSMPTAPLFQSELGQDMLYRVLSAFSLHCPEIGYCQSMNLLGAALLLAMKNEETAFWLLEALVVRILPTDFFTSTLLGVRTEIEVCMHVSVSSISPNISLSLHPIMSHLFPHILSCSSMYFTHT